MWRLCSRQQLFSLTVKRARTHGKKPGLPVCDDLVERDFTATTINEVWLTDIERHEALSSLAVVKGHRFASVAAGVG
nr:hypothetical protein GCM10023233_30310 [Brevibacterium otitidis]